MAMDYLVWVKGFAKKLKVRRIAASTGLHRIMVAGLLMEFWEWCEDQTDDGFLAGIRVRDLSEICPETVPQFWDAVSAVGWIAEERDGVRITRFERWMGRSAKVRLKDRERKRQSRNSLTGCPQGVRSKTDKSRTKRGQNADETRTTNTSTNTSTERGMNSPLTPSCPEAEMPASRAEERPAETRPEMLPPEPPVLVFPCVGSGPKEWGLTPSYLAELRASYPSLDVEGEARKALAWINADPARRKTARGMRRFLVGWMSRSNDRRPAGPARRSPSIGDRIDELFKSKEAT